MAHFHQWRRTQIRIPNPIVTLYYAQLFPLVRIWIRITVQITSQMVTVPILGTDLHLRDLNLNLSPLVEMSHKGNRQLITISNPVSLFLNNLLTSDRCRIFQRGCQLQKWAWKAIIWPILVSQKKPHENERNWTEKVRVSPPPPPPLGSANANPSSRLKS